MQKQTVFRILVFPAFFSLCTWVAPLIAQNCDFTFDPVNPCPETEVTFTVANPQAGHVYTFSFGTSGKPSQKGNTIKQTFPYSETTKVYTVTLRDSLNGMEICNKNLNITVKPSPDPSIDLGSVSNGIKFNAITGIFSGCNLLPPMELKVVNGSSTFSSNISYQISWGDGNQTALLNNTTFSLTTELAHTYTKLGSFPIGVTATNNVGCSRTKGYQFYSGSNPKISFGSPGSTQNLCPPATLNFPLDSFQNNSPGTQYLFQVNGVTVKTYTQNDVPKIFSHTFTEPSCGKSQPGGAGANTYSVQVIATNPCGSTPINIGGITVNGAPKASIKVTPPPKSCPGAVYTFANASYGGAAITYNGQNYLCDSTTEKVKWQILPATGWTLINGNPNNSQTLTIQFDSVGTYSVKLTVENGAGVCGNDMTTRTVVIASPPTAGASITYLQGANKCLPVKIRLNNASTGPSLSYKWVITRTPAPTVGSFTFEPPTSDTSASPIINILKPGKYEFKLTTTNPCGSVIWSETIDIFAPPTLTLMLPTICENKPLNIAPGNLSLSDGGLPVTLTWEFPNGTPDKVTLPFPQLPTGVTFTGAGPYTVTVTAENSCGSITSTAILNFAKNPVPDFTYMLTPVTGCAPVTLTATDKSQINAAQANPFRWTLLNDATGATVNTTTTKNPNFPNLQAGKYTLRLVVGNGCDTLTKEEKITVLGRPTVNFPPIKNKPCGSGSPELVFTHTTGGLPVTYKWDTPGGSPSSSNDSLPVVTYSQPGIYTITLTVGNSPCGTATATQTFTVSAVPKADVQPKYNSPNRCLPVEIDFELTSLAGVNYKWEFLPASAVEIIKGSASSANPTVRIKECGIVEYRLSAENDCDKVFWSKKDTFYKAPTITPPMLADSQFCQKAVLNFTGNTFDNGCDPTATVRWKFPGAIPDFYEGTNPVDIRYSSPNTGMMFTVTAIGSNVCKTDSVKINLQIDAPENLSLSVAQNELCKKDPPETMNGLPVGGKWFWNGSEVSNVFDPQKYPVGTHTLIYQKGNGACTAADTLIMEVKDLPVVNAGSDDTLCIEKQWLVLKAIQPPTAGGTWSCVENPAALKGDTFLLNTAGPGKFTLRFTFTDKVTDCSNFDERTVTVIGNTPFSVQDTLYCFLPGLVNLPQHNTPGLTYIGPAVVQPGNRFDPMFYGKDTIATVFFTYKNAADCEFVSSIKVKIQLPLPPGAVKAGPDTTLCAYDPPLPLIGQPAPGAGWVCDNCPSGTLKNPASGQWLFDPSATDGGVFTLTFTYGKDNCAQTDTRIITVIKAVPAPGDNQAACLNSGLQTLTAGIAPPTGYVAYWTGKGVTDSLKGEFNPILAGVGQHNITLQWRHVNSGCTFSASKIFKVNVLPKSAFTIEKPYCAGKNIVFDNTTAFATKQTWYDNGQLLSNAQIPTGIQLTAGNHLIRLVSVTAETCADTAELQIFVTAPPSVTSKPDKTEGCGPLSVIFKNTFTSTDSSFYVITGNGKNYTLPANSIDTLLFEPGEEDVVYTVRVVAQNQCADAEAEFKIKVKARPTAQIGVSYPEPCSGAPLTVLVTSKGGNTQNVIYTSTGSTYNTTLNQALVLKFYTDTLLIIRLLLVSTNECPPPDTAFVDVLVKPAEFEALAQVQADSTQFCIGKKVKLKGFATPGADTYWIAPNGSKILGDSIEVDVTAGLNKWVFVADGCGYDTSVVEFTGKPAPTFAIDYLKTVCPDVPVEFKVTTNGQVKFFFGDGAMSTQLPANHTYQLADTTLMLKATLSSTEGCTFDWTGPITIFPRPKPVIQVSDTLCSGIPVSLSSIGNANVTCVWRVGNPGIAYDGCNPVVTFQNAGLQPLVLSVSSLEGCMAETTKTVFVRQSPKPALSVTPSGAVCASTTLRFESKSSNATGLSIDFGDNSTATGGPIFEHTYKKGGSYTVRLTATKDGICAATTETQIQVFDRPDLGLTLIENCTQVLGYTLRIADATLQAKLTGPNFSDSTSTSFTGLLPGKYTLQLTSKITGCRADTSIQILTVNELQFVQFSPDTCRVRLGDSCRTAVSVNQATGVAFLWSDGITEPLRTLKPNTEGLHRYILTATDARSCAITDTAIVIVVFDKDPAVLPDAFTPNGDGFNDFLSVRSRFPISIQNMTFRVYDKWDALVFEAPPGCLPNTNGTDCDWDGYFKGEEAQQGTYRAIVHVTYINGESQTFVQNIQLIR